MSAALSLVQSESGRPPQSDLEVEAATLVACMNRPDLAAMAMALAGADDYYSGIHREIAKAICSLIETGSPCTPANVMLRLRETGRMPVVGGESTIVEMLDRSPAVQSVLDRYASRVRDLARLRRLGDTLRQLLAECYQPVHDVSAFMGRVSSSVNEATQADRANGVATSLDTAKEVARAMAEPPRKSIPTGFRGLDRLTHGFEGSALYILAARTGMGKTAMMLGMVRAAAAAGHSVLVVSLEMPRLQLTRRMLCSAAGISVNSVKERTLSYGQMQRFTACSSDFAKLPISFADTPGQTLLDIQAAVRTHAPELLVVDHLGLVSAHSEVSSRRSREQEIASISRGLKSLALGFDMPVLALCQVGRDVAKGARRPSLSDLRESGAIEQDADGVWMIHRPGYYDPKADAETQRQAEICVAKNRDGETGVIDIEWDTATATFKEQDAAWST